MSPERLRASTILASTYFGLTAYLAELTRVSQFMPPSQFDISWDDLRQVRLRAGSIRCTTQRAIADYLDTETARIDALIAKKRRDDRAARRATAGLPTSDVKVLARTRRR